MFRYFDYRKLVNRKPTWNIWKFLHVCSRRGMRVQADRPVVLQNNWLGKTLLKLYNQFPIAL